MKNIKYFILGFILASIVFTSCDIDTCDESVFDDCYLDEPIDAFFVLNISKNANQDSVLIMLYKGKIDDGEMIDSFYSYLEEESYYLDVDQYYSGVAEYYINGDTIKVVDGQKLRTVETVKCDETCWKIKGDVLDLRLKF